MTGGWGFEIGDPAAGRCLAAVVVMVQAPCTPLALFTTTFQDFGPNLSGRQGQGLSGWTAGHWHHVVLFAQVISPTIAYSAFSKKMV